ncbi:MAG: LysR family transcriptional regulator [Pseudomonadota bacterium]
MNIAFPNIRHLAAFAATVRHGTVTAAAHEIALTQSALTQAIARLERTLNCRLFDRHPDGMCPTEAGRLLAPRAAKALELIGSPRVTATQARAFLALSRKGGYSEAAKSLGVAPASLHRAVADLSLALDERLVERRGRHLALTAKGEARARSFGLAMAELRSGFAEVSDWLGKASGRIVIGAMPLCRARWLPQAIIAFLKVQPEVEVAVIEGSHAELSGPLRHGEIDFLLGALRKEGEFEDLIQAPVFCDRPKIILSSSHPLARNKDLSASDLRRYPWVLPPAGTPLRVYWEEMMSSFGKVPEVAVECGSVITIRELMLDTDMLTLLSSDQLRVEIEADLHVHFEPPKPVERIIGITTRRDWRPTPTQRKMLDILQEAAKQIS